MLRKQRRELTRNSKEMTRLESENASHEATLNVEGHGIDDYVVAVDALEASYDRLHGQSRVSTIRVTSLDNSRKDLELRAITGECQDVLEQIRLSTKVRQVNQLDNEHYKAMSNETLYMRLFASGALPAGQKQSAVFEAHEAP